MNAARRTGRPPLHGHSAGGRRSHEYMSWQAMIARCYHTGTNGYALYGGRGITVCDLWRESFQEFLYDVGPAPSRSHSLDRIDNARGYEPGNVRWATVREQGRNRRTNLLLTIGGVTKTLVEWCEHYGVPMSRVRNRLRRGWPVEQAFAEAPRVVWPETHAKPGPKGERS